MDGFINRKVQGKIVISISERGKPMTKNLLGTFFEENYRAFKDYLRHRYTTLNEYDVEDIIQQTIVKLLYKGDDMISIKDLSSYIYSSLSNNAKDYFKKYDRIELHEDHSEHFHKPTLTIEEEILLKELKTIIKDTLFKMDPKSRFVFIETEISGRSYRDLVEQTGEKLGTLLSRKNRAKKKLQKVLYGYLGTKGY